MNWSLKCVSVQYTGNLYDWIIIQWPSVNVGRFCGVFAHRLKYFGEIPVFYLSTLHDYDTKIQDNIYKFDEKTWEKNIPMVLVFRI